MDRHRYGTEAFQAEAFQSEVVLYSWEPLEHFIPMTYLCPQCPESQPMCTCLITLIPGDSLVITKLYQSILMQEPYLILSASFLVYSA